MWILVVLTYVQSVEGVERAHVAPNLGRYSWSGWNA